MTHSGEKKPFSSGEVNNRNTRVLRPMGSIAAVTPLRLTLIVVLLVFLLQTCVMFLLFRYLPPCPMWFESLLHAFLLVAMVCPALYFFLYRPMAFQINRRKQAEEALGLSYDQLRQRVKERTVELATANKEVRRAYQVQSILYQLLQISMKALPLSEVLARTIDLIISVPWLRVEAKGCIFLVEEDVLVMKAQKGLGEAIRNSCARVPFGKCLCGRAASSGRVEFAHCIDERHDIHYEGMGPHGHYCVPILSGSLVLGVICFYVQEGHHQEEEELEFLRSAANALAGIIVRRQGERERARLAAAVEAAVEAVIITDVQGIIRYVNPAFEQVSGYPREEALGNPVAMLESGQKDDAYMKEMWNTISRGDVWAGHFVNRKKDGDFYEVEATISPIRDQSANSIHFVSVQRDVTHERKMEKELRQAQKMEAMGTLAGGIAHDFNNILAAIMGYTEIALLEIPEEGEAMRHDLNEVLKASHRAGDLVAQILAFSRKTEQEQIPLSLHVIVKEAMELLRASLPSTIEIRQNIPSNSGKVMADATQMHQVLMNLCTNAKHAMGEKGGVLTVDLAPVDMGEGRMSRFPDLSLGPYLRLTVQDTGYGMDSKTIERIFDPYFTTKEKGEGTGLGLSMVHGIVTSHGGRH